MLAAFHADNMASAIVCVCLTLTLLVVAIGAESDPCVNFTVVEHNGDRGTSCTYITNACDNLLDQDWYRFQDDHQTFPNLTTECPEEYSCGAGLPVWLNGTYPGEVGGVVNRTACMRYHNDCCYGEIDIRIKRCTDFYVYFLNKTPACPARYCLDSDLPCPTPPPTVPPTPSSSPPTPDSTMNSTAVFPSRGSSVLFSIVLSTYPVLDSILN